MLSSGSGERTAKALGEKGGRANPKISAREAGAGHDGAEMASSAAAAALELSWGAGGFPGSQAPLRLPLPLGQGPGADAAGRAPSGNRVGEHV